MNGMSDESDRIVEVYSAGNAAEAHMVKLALDDAGIESRVVGELLNGVVGEIPVGDVSTPRVWVHEDDAVAARSTIVEWETHRKSDVPGWTCPECEAEVDAGFDTCWKCLYNPHAC